MKGNLQLIANHLTKKEETLAIAESVTSGLLMAAFSEAKNATMFFQGGLTAYNLGQKTRQLNIDPIHAEKTNCVSEKVAGQMATNVARQFVSHWGIGITGYAVPVPALHIKECFALYAIAYNGDVVRSGRVETRLRGQARVQRYFVEKVMEEFYKCLIP